MEVIQTEIYCNWNNCMQEKTKNHKRMYLSYKFDFLFVWFIIDEDKKILKEETKNKINGKSIHCIRFEEDIAFVLDL